MRRLRWAKLFALATRCVSSVGGHTAGSRFVAAGGVAVVGLGIIGPVEVGRSAPPASERPGEKEREQRLPDRPEDAAIFRSLRHQNEQRTIPKDAMPKAIARVRQLRADVAKQANQPAQALAEAAFRGGRTVARVARMPVGPLPRIGQAGGPMPEAEAAPPLGANIDPTAWTWIGPGNVGGRIRSILVHPTDPRVIWVGSVAGGVWKTASSGVSWSPLYDFMASLVISTMVLDPRNPDRLFVGTGEGFYNGDAYRGFGIFTSDDGGRNWTQLSATTGDDYRYVNRLALSSDGLVLLAATRNGLFRSEAAAPNAPGQAFMTTELMAQGGNNKIDFELLDVRFHPTDPSRCMAAGRNGRAFYSTDGGKTWSASSGITPINGFFNGRVELTYARANPQVVYASVDHRTGSPDSGQLYRSLDGGRTFVLRNTGTSYLYKQGWYANAVWAGDPTNPNLVVVAGLDIYRSTDGGLTLTKISDWRLKPKSAHADHHAIVAHAGYNGTTNRIVYFGNDGGLYRANDVTTVSTSVGWTAMNRGLGITQFFGAAGNVQSGKIAAGAQDNGTVLFDPAAGNEGYTEMTSGDGGVCAADPNDPLVLYGEYVNLTIQRSDDGGATAHDIYDGIDDAGTDASLFIAPYVLDVNDSNVMLAGGSRLWRSRTVKSPDPSWASIKPAIGTSISAIAVAQGNSKLIWVGHAINPAMADPDDGAVFKTTSGDADSPTWTRVSTAAAGLPKRYCTRITIDPSNNDRVYLTFGGYSAGNVWKTTDGGTTWKDVGGALPEVPAYTLAIHPDDSNFLYVGNEVGVFASPDGGQSWLPTNQGPTNCSVNELFWMKKVLVAATHGRGLFRIDLGSEDNGAVAEAVPVP